MKSAGTNAPVPFPDLGIPGVNSPGCHSADRPVLLLHGSFSSVASNFSAMVPALRDTGHCIYGFDYGGVGSVAKSATDFAALVAQVREATGAPMVDVVGYSQGGLVLRTALRLNGLADRVATAVLIAPSFHGTTSPLTGSLPPNLCPACADQAAGSPLLRQLDVGGDLDGSVRYAVVSTRNDVVVVPVSSQVPNGPPDRVRSIVVENQCPAAHTDHIQLPATPGVISWVVDALNTGGRPAAAALTC